MNWLFKLVNPSHGLFKHDQFDIFGENGKSIVSLQIYKDKNNLDRYFLVFYEVDGGKKVEISRENLNKFALKINTL